MADREGASHALAALDSGNLVSVLDAVSDISYVFTTAGEFKYWNDAMASTTGYSDDEIADLSPLEVFADDDRDAVVDALRRVVDEGEQQTVAADLVTKDGRTIPYEFASVRLGDDARGDTVIAGAGRNIAEQIERERQLRHQNERLEEFTAVVSHDLRNPLDVAHARIEIAQAECESEHLDVARESLRRMAQIVEDSLQLAKQGQSVAEAEWISFERVIRDAWRQVETEDATLTVANDARLHADGDRVQHIFENLFRNAVEHASEDVAVTVGRTDEGFYVADDGPGIDADDREQVFEPGTTHADDGTGFGLSIVRRVAEAHGWEVEVTASEESGARFDFTDVDIRPS